MAKISHHMVQNLYSERLSIQTVVGKKGKKTNISPGKCQDSPPQDSPLGGNPEVGNPDTISYQDYPPQL